MRGTTNIDGPLRLREFPMRALRCLPILALAAAPLAAQMTAAGHVARGDSAQPYLHPDVALRHYQAALALDSLSFEANWKAARSISDVAKQLLGDSLKDRRDSLYSVGRTYAERALRTEDRKSTRLNSSHTVIS